MADVAMQVAANEDGLHFVRGRRNPPLENRRWRGVQAQERPRAGARRQAAVETIVQVDVGVPALRTRVIAEEVESLPVEQHVAKGAGAVAAQRTEYSRAIAQDPRRDVGSVARVRQLCLSTSRENECHNITLRSSATIAITSQTQHNKVKERGCNHETYDAEDEEVNGPPRHTTPKRER